MTGVQTCALPICPNLLRVILGEPVAPPPGNVALDATALLHDEMVVLEANVDDMNPELYDAAVDALFRAGARDVTLAPLAMKKGRPGTLLQVIAPPELRARIAAVMLRETTTIGVRSHAVQRLLLPREESTVTTTWGAVRVKVVTLPDGSRRATPEYDDCKRVAAAHDVPAGRVYAAAQAAAMETAGR